MKTSGYWPYLCIEWQGENNGTEATSAAGVDKERKEREVWKCQTLLDILRMTVSTELSGTVSDAKHDTILFTTIFQEKINTILFPSPFMSQIFLR